MPAAPEADPRLNEFIILQAQNAGLFLGQIPHPHSGEKHINLRAAKSVIDSLEMLASKTRGNLTASETKLLATALDNLRDLGAARPRAVWLQTGIRDDAFAAVLADAGILVVQDRCLMVEQQRRGTRPATA